LATDPAVVVIEDAEHCDDASAELIAALLARMLPARPWLVVVTQRGGTTGLHHGRGFAATPIHLAPLDATTAAELAARLAEHTPVPVHRLPHLIEQASGNPLFLAALVSAQADHADELPRSVEAIIAARVDGLDPDDRRALRRLSVLGDRFDADLLDAALGPHGLSRDQHERWRRLAEFITIDGDAFAFRNALVREVAYEGLSFRRRRQLHASVADAIDDADSTAAAQLPGHLLRAERWSDAWIAARAAAERAREDGANAVAGELYDMALRAARRLKLAESDVADAALAAGEVWERAGVWARALRAYEVAAAAMRDRNGQLGVTLRRARTHAGAGRYPQALRLYRRVITAASSGAGTTEALRLLARAHAGYAAARLGQGRPADAVDHARQAVGLADLASDDATLADAHHLLDRAHTALGDHAAAAHHRDAALPVFAALGDLAAQGTVLHDLGRDAHRAGRLEEALWLYGRSHDARVRAGDVLQVAASANAIGEVLLVLGRHDDARAHFTEALRAWRGARAPVGVAEATCNLGVVALRDGHPAEAVRLLEEAADLTGPGRAEALGDRVLLPLAEALLACSRYVEAWDAASRVLASAGNDATGTAHRLRGEALLRTGGAARAHAELAAALDALTDPAEVARVRGLLAEATVSAG
jgi:tetratricopeptide (TPR) repeat protein